jgi:uncharacterized protein GlcG (DUF336 family)
MKSLNQDGWSPHLESIMGPTKHETGILTSQTRLVCSVATRVRESMNTTTVCLHSVPTLHSINNINKGIELTQGACTLNKNQKIQGATGVSGGRHQRTGSC